MREHEPKARKALSNFLLKKSLPVADSTSWDRVTAGNLAVKLRGQSSWEGFSDADPSSGCGWAILGTSGGLVGHIFIHNRDEPA
jgi:hypothetical protein